MLRLIHCRPRCSQLCWSGTYDINDLLTIALYDLLNTKPEPGHQCIIIVSVLILAAFAYKGGGGINRVLGLVGATDSVNSILNLLSLLLELISKSYRSYLTLRDLTSMAAKRRRSESDIQSLPQTRRRIIEDTARREQSKRKWVDDLDSPAGDYFFYKKPRLLSICLADIEWTFGKRRARPAQSQRYMYQWIPKRPPWYTARVRKRYARFGNPRKRRVDYSERQVQGFEDFLSAYNPHLNALWIETLGESLSASSSVTDAPAAAAPRPVGSPYQPRVEDEDEEL